MELVTSGLCTFRGAARSLKILAQWFDVPTPCHVTIQNWVMRLGADLLQSQQPFQGDWILIPDHMVEQGKEKCLVLLGVSTETLASKIKLEHSDVQVLAVLPQEHATGETVLEAFREITRRYGPPAYIVSDKGSDLKKAIRLYREDHPETAEIYDITHDVAIQLKNEFQDDPRWEAFSKRLSQAAQETRQTELQFLTPNALRSKSRFLNLGATLAWAEKMLNYSRQVDLHEIDGGHLLDKKQIQSLQMYHGTVLLKDLTQLQDRRYQTRDAFLAALKQAVGDLPEDLLTLILVTADKNRPRFTEKFGWLEDYREDVDRWSQMYGACRLAMTQVKREGLHCEIKEELTMLFSQHLEFTTESAVAFRDRILACVEEQGRKVPEGQIWLGTSDIIESIFGKYKIFSARSPLKTLGRLILTIPVFTQKLTVEMVKNAMENQSMKRFTAFCKKLFGVSSTSKRRSAFSRPKSVPDREDPVERREASVSEQKPAAA